MLRFFCAAIAAAFLGAWASADAAEHHGDGHADAEIFAKLQEGGYVLVMRHAHSPGGQKAAVGMSAGCRLQPGRGLDAAGFYQARMLGEKLAENNVPILKAYTSMMCRAWDTAALTAGGGPVEAHPSQVSTDPATIAAMKAQVAAELAANPGTNIILASHSNIAPLYGALVKDSEEELPEGVISVVDPESWRGLEGEMVRIESGLPLSQSVTME
ncbi:MAG: histidine phosphatase family protein [Pseudomonadota bacterium]